MVINEFKDNELVFPPITPPIGPTITSEQQYEAFVTAYGFEGYTRWDGVVWLVVNAAVFRALQFLGLRYVRYENR